MPSEIPDEFTGDANEYARAEELVDKFHAEWPGMKFEMPVETVGLSFHDVDCNEMLMVGLKWIDPTPDCLVKANRIFVRTFLEECG